MSVPLVLQFPAGSSPASRYALRRALRKSLRATSCPIILDIVGSSTLNHDDISLLLDCAAQATGRDAPLVLAAQQPATRILLEVTRLASLFPVSASREQALASLGVCSTEYEVETDPSRIQEIPTQCNVTQTSRCA